LKNLKRRNFFGIFGDLPQSSENIFSFQRGAFGRKERKFGKKHFFINFPSNSISMSERLRSSLHFLSGLHKMPTSSDFADSSGNSSDRFVGSHPFLGKEIKTKNGFFLIIFF